jgi:hypothetical protein
VGRQQAAEAIHQFSQGLDAASYAGNPLDKRVWDIAENWLPALHETVSALLTELGPPDE